MEDERTTHGRLAGIAIREDGGQLTVTVDSDKPIRFDFQFRPLQLPDPRIAQLQSDLAKANERAERSQRIASEEIASACIAQEAAEEREREATGALKALRSKRRR